MKRVSLKIEAYQPTADELLKRMSKEQAITAVQGILRRMEESLNVPDMPAAKARMEKCLRGVKAVVICRSAVYCKVGAGSNLSD